jgi:tryptophan halogenase
MRNRKQKVPAMHHVRSVIIVGGGSSGWMAAAYFSKIFPELTITLVESKNIPVIGVGEATVPLLNLFMAKLGYSDPQAWMPACDATYKTGILFDNWYEIGDRYWHPFDYLDYVDLGCHTGHCWYTWHRNSESEFQTRRSFYDSFFPSTKLNAQALKAPSFREFAFHFDAHLFGEFLRQSAVRVHHVRDDVLDVSLNDQGEIATVHTAEHGDLTADLFLDCTGFRRRLISRVGPTQGLHSYANSLFCDRAVVIRIPHSPADDREKTIPPFVKASAQAAGWIWSIPLYSRMSSGYVYSSQFISEENAELELRRYWKGKNLENVELLNVRFETGKLPCTWIKNCIAIGLAGGFIEPLESTGLAITQVGIEMAASMLDARFFDQEMIGRYNAHLSKFYNDIMEFIIVHYCFTKREDTPFWKAVKNETYVPPSLQARLEVFRRLLPTSATKGTTEVFMFRDISWFAVLLGMNFQFDPEPVSNSLLTAAKLIRERKRESVKEMMVKLPNHYRFLKENIYGRP